MQPRRPSNPAVPLERAQKLFRPAFSRYRCDRKLKAVRFVSGHKCNSLAIRRPSRPAVIPIMPPVSASDLTRVAAVNRTDHERSFIRPGKTANKNKTLSVRRKADDAPHVIDDLLWFATANHRHLIQRSARTVLLVVDGVVDQLVV